MFFGFGLGSCHWGLRFEFFGFRFGIGTKGFGFAP